MEVIRLSLTPQFLGALMDLPPTAQIVSVRMTEVGTFEFGVAVEGDFPQNRQLIITKSLVEIGAFVRDPLNERYDIPKNNVQPPEPESHPDLNMEPEIISDLP